MGRWLACCLLFWGAAVQGQDNAFDKMNTAYEKGDFDAVIQAYDPWQRFSGDTMLHLYNQLITAFVFTEQTDKSLPLQRRLLRRDPYVLRQPYISPEVKALCSDYRVGGLSASIMFGFHTTFIESFGRQDRDSLTWLGETSGQVRNAHFGVSIAYRPSLGGPWSVGARYYHGPRTYRARPSYEIITADGSSQPATLDYQERLVLDQYLLFGQYGTRTLQVFGQRFNTYLGLGVGRAYLQESRLERLMIDFPGDELDRRQDAGIIFPCHDGTPLRKRWSWMASVQVGASIFITSHWAVSIEGRYDPIFSIAEEPISNDCPMVDRDLYFVNQNRHLHGLFGSAGITYFLYTTSMRRDLDLVISKRAW